ncbi:MAG TPA: LLM class flavin-dependent oxidoreductase [Pseudonocardia sp.]|jgi:alkanesulfonate monooxygenase SsuD/methylene tetrahydromethanopterin reductase-like flavin-dependent oxidoreductase (luciferase family)|nr:LLM class flavin-dependent oxidoreductase [Pseudonocardia sp.]
MKFGVLFLPSIGPSGTPNTGKAYNDMVQDLREYAVLIEDLGFDAMFLTEHHFEVEGYEVNPNALLWAVDLAARTKRLKFGSLGMQVASWNPVRLAEDIALVDQLTQGRFIAGLARGYQKRENQVLGSSWKADIATSDKSASDQRNWRYFEEALDVMRKAWSNDLWSHDGEFFQYPPKGIEWTHPATTQGVKDGQLTEIGISPRPFTQPHPPLWQVISFSEATVRLAARNGETPLLMMQQIEPARKMFEAYVDESEKMGRDVAFGDNTALVRDTYLADSTEQAREDFAEYAGDIWLNWLAPYGFIEAMKKKDEDSIPYNMDTVMDRLSVVGDPAYVTGRIKEFRDELNLPYYILFAYNSMPKEKVMHSLKLFSEQVMPNFQD